MEREIRVKCTYISLSTSDAAGTAWNTIEHFCFNKAKTTVCHKSDLKCDLKKINQNLGLHAVHVVHKSNFSRWDQGSRCMLPIGTEKTSQGEDKGEWF